MPVSRDTMCTSLIGQCIDDIFFTHTNSEEFMHW